MKFGIFDHVEQRRDVPLDQQYRERLELLMQADRGGIYAYHVAEHHHSFQWGDVTHEEASRSLQLFVSEVVPYVADTPAKAE